MALPMPLRALDPTQEPAADDPNHWRWTIGTFFRAGELGLFPQEKHVELIEGEIYIHVSPKGSRHSAARYLLEEVLRDVFGRKFMIRSEEPILHPDDSAPEPDISVVAVRQDHYATEHPKASDIIVVAEISDSSLSFDRGTKASHYGKAGIPEYWIVNLVADQVEVFRKPDPEIGYREVTIHKKDDVIATLAAPNKPIKVADLIPNSLNI